ncbi:hypothetical protein SAMN04487894_10981 [Niabella drilacis]|uniref:Uncharacterized protein n=2 Tax=Niabella drilacis (strain DSM 25811 / CCM 8410 / CCUG 62505 / LMG 26954 / E90) TaxID=1285928 RepID=A0A1G6UT31_NIADE|nr:hypothetical protein SAMN04487894_10981 [Niabella drilacis]
MNRLMNNIVLLKVFILLSFGCKAQTIQSRNKELAGMVYALDTLLAGKGHNEQIQAVRIDDTRGDTLLVKYKIGRESFLDADFVWDMTDQTYRSLHPLTYGSHAQYRSQAILRVGVSRLHLQLGNDKHKLLFRKSYKKSVNTKTHRDPYYAEDGFSLEP